MENIAKAHLKYVRMSSSKIRIVINLVRSKPVSEAISILKNTPKIAAAELVKLVKSAVANAENNHDMDSSRLYIREMYACEGPTFKRIQPRAQGRAYPIRKRTSHVTVVLAEKE